MFGCLSFSLFLVLIVLVRSRVVRDGMCFLFLKWWMLVIIELFWCSLKLNFWWCDWRIR